MFLETRWKTAHFYILNFSILLLKRNDFRSSIRHSVSLPDQTTTSFPGSLSYSSRDSSGTGRREPWERGWSNTSKFVKDTPLRVVFSTLFSVFEVMMKHCVSCLFYYVKNGSGLPTEWTLSANVFSRKLHYTKGKTTSWGKKRNIFKLTK